MPLSDGWRTHLEALVEEVEGWCTGRSWLARAPVVAWFAWIGVRHLGDPFYESLFGALNLGIHEAGHLLFSWFGLFLGIAGGTFLQLAAPLISAVMFARQPDWFAVPVCGAWLATNLYNVATYMGDARVMELPLVSVGDGDSIIHDWNYLLGATGLLRLDGFLAGGVRVAAFALMWGSLAAAVWMLVRMARNPAR
ncbi:MAG: hypothetical protein ABW221_13775 [Vicinamibacteria bacterium]